MTTKPFDQLRFCRSASALIDHWLNLRQAGATCPSKSDFTPMKLGRHLPDVFMLEWVNEDTVFIRVAGTRTTNVTAQDSTGKNLLDVCLPEHASSFREFYHKMRSGGHAGVTEHPLPNAAFPCLAKSLQLPLLDKNGEPTFFVGVAKAISIDKRQQDFRQLGASSTISLDIWFSNLTATDCRLEAKTG